MPQDDEYIPLNDVSSDQQHPETESPEKLLAKQVSANVLTAKTLENLLKKGLKVDFADPSWYGWEPLHYIASTSNPSTLETILQSGANINSLTFLSENALHVLLAHSKTSKTFHVSCQGGHDLYATRIINRETQEMIKCASILITKGINLNHCDFWGESPILIALKRKFGEIVELLLGENPDLDSSRDPVSGKTPREFLQGRKTPLPPPIGSEPGVRLFEILKSGDEEKFLKEKIRNFVNVLDGEIEENSSCTMLQYCLRRGLIYSKQSRGDFEEESEEPTSSYLVEVFCTKGMAKSVQYLLEEGADVDSTLRKFEGGLSVLEVAIIKGYFPLVALILHNYQLTPVKITRICTSLKKLEAKSEHLNHTISIVLDRLLEEKNVTYQVISALKNKTRLINRANILRILRFEGSLVEDREFLAGIDAEVLRTHLNDCVLKNDSNVEINYSNFGEKILENFPKNLQTCFDHPVFKILILRKWNHLCWYFYLNLLFHSSFYVFLNWFVVYGFVMGDHGCVWYQILGLFFLFVFILKEILQMVTNKWSYFEEFQNWVEIFFAVVAFWVFVWYHDVWAVLAVLTSNLVFFLMLEQVPFCAKYIIILKSTIFYLKYLFFYIVQFVAFAICFFILFSKSDENVGENLSHKLFETVILFTGNLDYMKTPWKEENNSTTHFHNFQFKEGFSKIVLTLFVLLMAVILNNLLLGLLVTDMSDINKNVKVFEQVKRAGFVVRLEKFLEKWNKNSIFKKLQSKSVFHKDKCIVINEEDRKILDDEDKQLLDFILTKKIKKENSLKNLWCYIRNKMNEKNCGTLQCKTDKELLRNFEKIIERKLKKFADCNRKIKK
ncbi:uncharacterized protein LOC123009666 isoform X2 [Tribolium madens]|uniref:uncharacterized protein LOC123009666 isoform X2 n=1 Tax=Tribolium madens TaxID=41895 RepID=UPI001CF725FC|nr:uncharacterized protein LOC123009666 isoform X2 [Tribolium madens]